MAFLDRYVVLEHAQQGELWLFKAQDKVEGRFIYLLAEPTGSPALKANPGLAELEPMATEDNLRWWVASPPTGLKLHQYWVMGQADDKEVDGLLSLVGALAHLSATRPALLPSRLLAEHLWVSPSGSWVLDLCGLALAPEIRLGSSSNVTKALGELLDDLNSIRKLGPTLHFIMMRCHWGGFGSLEEVQETVTRIAQRHTPPESSESPIPEVQVPSPAQHTPARTGPPRKPWSITRVVAVGGTGLIVVLLILAGWIAANTPNNRPEQASVAAETPVSVSLSEPFPSPAPKMKPLEPLITLTDDHLQAEPVFHPTPETPPPPPPPSAPQKASTAPAPPPPPPVEEEPLDPIAQLDRKAAGDNPVTVQIVGRPLGRAYMFVNPGAPVISADAFSSLLKRPMTVEPLSGTELRVTIDKTTFVTADFLIIEQRVWLILRPGLLTNLRLRVTRHGDGILDLEPVF